jgi:hypothetical protein
MTITITVPVTQSDIDNGIRADCWQCPVALALWRVTGWKWHISGYTVGAFPIARKQALCDLPLPVWEFIDRFDTDKTVLPFEFRMQVPEWVMNGGKRVKVEVIA